MKFHISIVATLASQRMLLDTSKTSFYDHCGEIFDFITQGRRFSLEFYARGILFCKSVLGQQYPQLTSIECGLGVHAVNQCLEKLIAEHGEYLDVQPADRPFLTMSPQEDLAFLNGTDPDDYTVITAVI